MNITLNPKLENFIQEQIRSGKYKNIDNVIEEALNLLEKRNQYDEWVQEISEKIDIADAQLDRGEGIEGNRDLESLFTD